MKVKLLKDHGVLGLKDDVVEVTEAQANYFKRTQVADEHREEEVNDLIEPEDKPEQEEDVKEADIEGVSENIEILSDMVDDETKDILIEDAAKAGIEIAQDEAVQPAEPVIEHKEEKSTHNTKEDKGATHRKTK